MRNELDTTEDVPNTTDVDILTIKHNTNITKHIRGSIQKNHPSPKTKPAITETRQNIISLKARQHQRWPRSIEKLQ